MLVHDRCRASLGSNRVRLKENRRSVGFVIKKSRLRWYGHIERNVDASWIKCCMAMEVDGIRQRIILRRCEEFRCLSRGCIV